MCDPRFGLQESNLNMPVPMTELISFGRLPKEKSADLSALSAIGVREVRFSWGDGLMWLVPMCFWIIGTCSVARENSAYDFDNLKRTAAGAAGDTSTPPWGLAAPPLP